MEGYKSMWRGVSSVIVGAGMLCVACTLGASSSDVGIGPAHALYFATFEAVKHAMGGNNAGYHPLAAGKLYEMGHVEEG